MPSPRHLPASLLLTFCAMASPGARGEPPADGRVAVASVADTPASLPDAAAHALGALLAQPPLRALPDTPSANLVAAPGLGQVAFADAAGVAALRWPGHVRVVDVGTDAAIGDYAIDGAGALTLSPNGRVFTVAGDGVVQVRDAATGELLSTMAGVRGGRVAWLGAHVLAYGQAGASTLAVRDLADGTLVQLPFDGGAVAGVAPVPGDPRRVVVVAARRIALVELAPGVAPRLVRDIARPGGVARAGDDVAPGPDGSLLFADGTAVRVLDPATLAVGELSFAPLRVDRAAALPDPDRLLLDLHGGDSVRGAYVYSRSHYTLARVGEAHGSTGRPHYQPALHREVAMDAAAVRLFDGPEAGAPVAVLDVIDRVEYEVLSAEAELGERLARYGTAIGGHVEPGGGRFPKRKAVHREPPAAPAADGH
jgi:hypothetical protein